MNKKLKNYTFKMIDELKAVCHSQGLSNVGDEFKIITQMFLYKFINDKFGVLLKQKDENIKNSANWEQEYSRLSPEKRDRLLKRIANENPILFPEELLSYLVNNSNKDDFAKIFDSAMESISQRNSDLFSTRTTGRTNIEFMEPLTQCVVDPNKRNQFAKALVCKLVNFSFAEAFNEHYDFFSHIFEYLIRDYNANSGEAYAEYYTPRAIATIMARLLIGDSKDLKSVTIYDPSAGTGTLLMALSHIIGENKCTIYAQDISQKSSKMLKLNLILNGIISSLPNIIQGDTLLEPSHFDPGNKNKLRKFDFVVSNPPFKLNFEGSRDELAMMGERFWAGVPNIPKKRKKGMPIYTLFIQHVINSLNNETGKGAIVVPTGFVSALLGVENAIIRKIVDERLITGVINMPSNVFANTGTNVSVLFFDKANRYSDVVLIDASKLGIDDKSSKTKKTSLTDDDIEKIVNTFIKREKIDEFSAVVTYDEITQHKYSLSPGQYFDIKIEYVDISEEEFKKQINEYSEELRQLFKESDDLQREILDKLGKLKYEKS